MGLKIFDPRTLSMASIVDEKLKNYYVDETSGNYIIETIAEYLARVTFEHRFPETHVTVLLPKEGSTPSFSFETTEDFDAGLNSFNGKTYAFVGGLADEDFIEIHVSGHPPVIIADDSVDLARIGEDQKLSIKKDGITNIVNETIEPAITNIINVTLPTVIKTSLGNNHESFLIENTEEPEVTVSSSWTVEKYNEQVGEFKAVVMIRDKSLNEIKTLMNILSFDYCDTIKVVNENLMLVDALVTLSCGIDGGTKKLFATITGMTENAKRIHLCFERCVLSERFWNIDSEISFVLEATAYLKAYLNMQGTADMRLNFVIGLSGYSNLQAQLPMILDCSANLTAYGRIQANMNMELEGQALLSAYKKLIADNIPISLNAQAVLKAYASLSAVSIPMSLVMQAQLASVPLNMAATMAMQLTIAATVTNAIHIPVGPWVANSAIINGLPSGTSVYQKYNTMFYIGQDLYLIMGQNNGTMAGYKWNGSGWGSYSAIVSGLPDIGFWSRPRCFYIESDLYMICGEYDSGVFNGFKWNGSTWQVNATITTGLSSTTQSKVSVFEWGGSYYCWFEQASTKFWKWNGAGWDITTELTNGHNSNYPEYMTHFKLGSELRFVGESNGNYINYSKKWNGSSWVIDNNIWNGIIPSTGKEYQMESVWINGDLYIICSEQNINHLLTGYKFSN